MKIKKLIGRFTTIVTCLVALGFNAFAKESVASPALSFSLNDPGTWRGVNLPLLLNSKNQKNLSQEYFDEAAEAGANIIRLSLRTDPRDRRYSKFTDEGGAVMANPPGLLDIDEAVGMAKRANLKVIIDMHTMPGKTGGDFWREDKYWGTFRGIWDIIAKRYKNNSTVVAFDLMNEPNILDFIRDRSVNHRMFDGSWSPPSEWRGTIRDYNLQLKAVINQIHQVSPERWIIIEGFGMYGNPVNFNWLKPVDLNDHHLIYSFHMYVPTNLTNIGNKDFDARGLVGKPFNPAVDMPKVEKALNAVLSFQRKYKVPIFVGEFGVTNDAIFKSDANNVPYNGACWLSTVVNKFNEYKWGWTFWDFWNELRKPQSKTDPRYIILKKALNGETVNGFCR